MMNWKGFVRKRSWPNRGTAPDFPEGIEERQEKSTVRIPGVRTEIRTECLRNTSPERYRYAKPLGLEM
jgi:hypothetical protein